MRRLVFALLLFLAAPAWAQVAHDGEATQSASSGAPITSYSITSKTTAGSNRVGIVGCAQSVPATVLGATWNGSAMTQLVTATNGTDGRGVFIWWIAAPPTSASTITIDTSGSGGAGSSGVCHAVSYNGAHQTTQTGATSSGSGTTSPATATCTANNDDMIVDMLYFLGAGTAPAVGSDQTNRGSGDQGLWFGATSSQPGTADDVMSWTLTSPTRWTTACVAIQPAAAASGGTGLRLPLLGVGVTQ